MPDTMLELVGWNLRNPTAAVLRGMGFKENEVRKEYSHDPEIGELWRFSKSGKPGSASARSGPRQCPSNIELVRSDR